jgi:hypothetical protein
MLHNKKNQKVKAEQFWEMFGSYILIISDDMNAVRHGLVSLAAATGHWA